MPVTLPATPLAAQADLEALAARVTKLEGGVGPTPPQPDQPSGSGSYISTPAEAPIVDDALNKWSIVASGGQQIAVQKAGSTAAPVVDTVTANVAKLGIDLVSGARRVVQQNKAGAWYWTAAPGSPTASWVQFAGPDGAPIPAGKIFSVSNGQIHKPDGSVFKPTGVDLWWTMFSTRDGGWNQGNQVIADWNTGAPLLQAFPDLNILRLAAFMESSGLGGFPTVAEIQPLVDFCTKKRIVLLLDPHDYSGGSNWVYSYADGSLQKAVAWVSAMGAAFKDHAYVWTQTQNEPGTPNDDEINALYDAWRNAGNPNPVIVGWVTWGYTDRVTHSILNRMHNVGIDLHRYAMSAGSDNMNVQDHINVIASDCAAINAIYKSADGEIPIGCYEFGDACCGHVEAAGQVAVDAVTRSVFKGWSAWNWCTDWNRSWGVDVLNNGGVPVNAGTIIRPAMVGV